MEIPFVMELSLGLQELIVTLLVSRDKLRDVSMSVACGTLILRSVDAPILTLPLGVDVDNTKPVSLNAHEDRVELKLRILPITAEELHKKLIPQWQQNDHIQMLFCNFCASPIAESPPGGWKVLSLPSAHWEELTDIWVCACTSNMLQNNEIIKATKQIRAKENCLLMGETHLILHTSNSIKNSIDLWKKNTDNKENASVICVRCKNALGYAEPSNADPSLRLFKHKLTTSLNQERNKFYWNTLETFISNTMISHSQAHTCFHFVLRNEELQLKAIILLLNWTSYMCASEDEFSRGKLMPVLKLLFLEAATQQDSAARLCSSWEAKHIVEYITLPEHEAQSIINALKQRNYFFAPPKRQINGMLASFLHYFPVG